MKGNAVVEEIVVAGNNSGDVLLKNGFKDENTGAVPLAVEENNSSAVEDSIPSGRLFVEFSNASKMFDVNGLNGLELKDDRVDGVDGDGIVSSVVANPETNWLALDTGVTTKLVIGVVTDTVTAGMLAGGETVKLEMTVVDDGCKGLSKGGIS